MIYHHYFYDTVGNKFAIVKETTKTLNAQYCRFKYVGEQPSQIQTFTIRHNDVILYNELVGSIDISFLENILLDKIIAKI